MTQRSPPEQWLQCHANIQTSWGVSSIFGPLFLSWFPSHHSSCILHLQHTMLVCQHSLLLTELLDNTTSLEPWLPILLLLKPPEGQKNQHLLALTAQSPNTVFWGWGHILVLCQVPKLCVSHLTGCTPRAGTAETWQYWTSAASASLLSFLHLLTYWLCKEGKSPLKELWSTQTTSPTSFLRIPTWRCKEGTQRNWNVTVYSSPGNYSNHWRGTFKQQWQSHPHRRGWKEAQL